MRIDVVMPTYNRASLIGPAIGSFAASTWDGAARLIVVDNNSSDGTRAAVEAAQAAHPASVVLVASTVDGGAMHTLAAARKLDRPRFALEPRALVSYAGNERAIREHATTLPWDIERARATIATLRRTPPGDDEKL